MIKYYLSSCRRLMHFFMYRITISISTDWLIHSFIGCFLTLSILKRQIYMPPCLLILCVTVSAKYSALAILFALCSPRTVLFDPNGVCSRSLRSVYSCLNNIFFSNPEGWYLQKRFSNGLDHHHILLFVIIILYTFNPI